MLKKFKTAIIIGIPFLIPIFFYTDPAHGSQCPRYEIKATIDTQQKKITAHQLTTFTNNGLQEIRELYFHIYPNRKYTAREVNFILRFAGYFKENPFPQGYHATPMDIRNVSAQNKALNFVIEGQDKTLLKIILDRPLNAGESVAVSMDFSVDIPHAYGRFGWNENTIQISRWYPILAVYTEKGWDQNPFYPFHRPFFSESADYSVELTVPQNQVIIHSGKQTRENLGGDMKTVTLESGLPIRDFTLAMSPDYRLVEEEDQGIKIKSFYLPGDEFYGKEALQDVKGLMHYYTQRFGKYP